MTARKVAAKAAAPKKNPAASIADRVEAFENYRTRARGLTFTNTKALERPPYVLGEDRGFAPPITISFPSDLTSQVMLDQAMRREDYFGALAVLAGGTQNLLRITRTFETYVKARGEGDAMALLVGLTMDALDHFIGPGAGDVAGGTPAS